MMSSLYIGATGLKSHGEGMAVITNNLANVNTVGFKQMSMQYADLLSQYLTASSANLTNFNQKGMGAMPLDTRTLFTLGGFESGTSATDLAINGIGFFGVEKNGELRYTRAGDFVFNKEGFLLDPSGWNVLGRVIVDGNEAATATPVHLPLDDESMAFMPARATTQIISCANLGGVEDKCVVTTAGKESFFSLASSWHSNYVPPAQGEPEPASVPPPLAAGTYGYSQDIEFYDSTGTRRTATVYYDKVGQKGGLTVVEYLVGMNPEEDVSARAGTPAAGLLLAGTITFSSNGEMAGMTAFSPPASGDTNLANWTPAPLAGGLPVIAVQPKGAAAQNITLDIGYVFADGASSSGGTASAGEADVTPEAIYAARTDKTLKSRATVNLGENPSSLYTQNDGYADGWLRNLTVTQDGIVRGYYSNNQTEDHYRITLYRFTSQDGLRREGNNHYSYTSAAGAVTEGIAGSENFGSVHEYELEQSNVDYAREFSLLIVTQRGFQMNSKVVTTSDEMLKKALELKR
ncbi:MAG: flagellar hook-basal body complex protein [Desulfovibrio sp.]|jgi:flagellar hook protein FlgE|nr:flagellar hook-basal body complex protein [Desulfovibrio sp.]